MGILLLLLLTLILTYVEGKGIGKVENLTLSTRNLNLTLKWCPPKRLIPSKTVLYSVQLRKPRKFSRNSSECTEIKSTVCNLFSLLPTLQDAKRSSEFAVLAYYSDNFTDYSVREKSFLPSFQVTTGPPVINYTGVVIRNTSLVIPIHGPWTPYFSNRKDRYLYLGEKTIVDALECNDLLYKSFLYEAVDPSSEADDVEVFNGTRYRHVEGSDYKEFLHGSARLSYKKLKPTTDYYIRLKAKIDNNNSGPNDTTAIFTTLIGAPETGPEIISITSENTTCNHRDVRVTWMVSSGQDKNGYVTYYEAQYREMGNNGSWQSIRVSRVTSASEQFATFSRLHRWSKYQIVVWAGNEGGMASRLNVEYSEDKVDETEYRARDLTCTVKNDNVLEIRWSLPKSYEECIDGYLVELFDSAANKKVSSHSVGGTDGTSLNIKLQKHGTYRVEVVPIIADNYIHSREDIVVMDEVNFREDKWFQGVEIGILVSITIIATGLGCCVIVVLKRMFCYMDVDMDNSKVLILAKEGLRRLDDVHFAVSAEDFDDLLTSPSQTFNDRVKEELVVPEEEVGPISFSYENGNNNFHSGLSQTGDNLSLNVGGTRGSSVNQHIKVMGRELPFTFPSPVDTLKKKSVRHQSEDSALSLPRLSAPSSPNDDVFLPPTVQNSQILKEVGRNEKLSLILTRTLSIDSGLSSPGCIGSPTTQTRDENDTNFPHVRLSQISAHTSRLPMDSSITPNPPAITFDLETILNLNTYSWNDDRSFSLSNTEQPETQWYVPMSITSEDSNIQPYTKMAENDQHEDDELIPINSSSGYLRYPCNPESVCNVGISREMNDPPSRDDEVLSRYSSKYVPIASYSKCASQ